MVKIIEPKLSETSLKIAQKRYLLSEKETPGQMFWRVAQHLAKPEINWGENGVVKKIAERFFERMVKFKFVIAGRAMFEAGNPEGTGQLSSCFVLPIEDNIRSIFKTLGDAAVIHKNNGGTGFNFSRIRPRGDKVKNVPLAASGPVDFLLAYSAALSKILQGSKRQGANIGILNCDHPDIEEFVSLKTKDGNLKNFNISVGVTDKFMEAVEKNKKWELKNPRNGEVWKTVKARKLFEMIAQQAWVSGDPGLAFLDRIEKDNSTPSLGKIEATNPCIAGDALITTDKGLVRLDGLTPKGKILVDKRTIGEEGVEIKKVTNIISQGSKQVFQLITKSGFSIKATADHKVLTVEGWQEISKLKLTDRILIQAGEGKYSRNYDLPFKVTHRFRGRNGRCYRFNFPYRWSQKLGQFLGWLIGDGLIRNYGATKGGSLICLTFGRKREDALSCFKHIFKEWFGGFNLLEPNERVVEIRKHGIPIIDFFLKLGVLDKPSSKKQVPKSLFTAPRIAVIGFLQGLFSSDGTIGFVQGKSSYIRLTSKSQKLLKQTQLLLLNLGIKARIYDRSRAKRKNIFPEYKTANGEVRKYSSDGKLWELEISKDSVPVFLKKIGFMFDLHKRKIEKLNSKIYYKTQFHDLVKKVKKLGKEEVYDLVEPKTRSFIANGFVVHNCGELPLLPYESCNLTSIVLSNHLKKTGNRKLGTENYVIDWDGLKSTIRLGVRLLDNMIEVNTYPIPEIEEMVKNGNRRIGLGVMGFAHLLYKLNVPYDSPQAVKLSEQLAKFIRRQAEKASLELGEQRGVFPNWDCSIFAEANKRFRNSALTMIAPTGTISILAETSSGIEPVFSLVTLRKIFFEDDPTNRPTKELVIVDPIFEEFLAGKRISEKKTKAILEQAAQKNNLKNVKGFSLKEKRILVTTHQIEPEWHLKIQAAWQKHFDNSVSKTINFPSQATVEDVKKVYLLAWKLGCKGITVYRDGSKKDQVLNLSQQKTEETIANRCPECGAQVVVAEGCAVCQSCGWSKCQL